MIPPRDEPAPDAPVADRAARPRSIGKLRGWIAPAVVVLASAIVLVLYLRPYADGTFATPIGDDTSWYIGRQRIVAAEGLEGLAGLHGAGVPLKVLPDRPGHPVSAALLGAVTGIGAYDLAYVLPAVVALLVGLAAGGLASTALREPRWAVPLYVIGVGASVFVARTAVMSHDNLIVDALLLGVVACAIVVSDGGRGTAAAVVLLAAAALTHWRFVVPFYLLLGALVVLLAPDAVRRRRAGEPIGGTPAGRLARLVGIGAAASAGALGLAPALELELPQVQGERTEVKSEQWMPFFRLGITAPWAGLGAIAGWFPADPRRRRTVLLMTLWGLSIPFAWALAQLIDRNIPIYRITAFALGLPVLATVLIVAVARFLEGRWRPLGALGAVLVGLAGAGLTLSLANQLWSAQFSPVGVETVRELTAAQAYLSRDAGDRPAIFVIERGAGTRERRAIRAVFTPETAARSAVYLGPVENLLAGRPTLETGDERYDRKSLRAWRVVSRLLPRDPVILRLTSFAHGAAPTGDWPELAAGVAVVQGPIPDEPLVVPPVARPTWSWLVGAAIALVAIAAAAGSGWSVALVEGDGFARALLAPTFGLAVLVLFGVAADRIGLVPAGGQAIGVTIASAASGWGLWAALRFGRSRRAARAPGAPARERAGAPA